MPKENTLDTLEKVIKSVCCLDLSRRMYELNDFNVPLLAQAIRQLLLGEMPQEKFHIGRANNSRFNKKVDGWNDALAEIKKIVEEI